MSDSQRWPHDVTTLGVDIGGSGVKASVLDASGNMLTERVRVETPYPCTPQRLIETVLSLVSPLPSAHRVAVGFPGLVRGGVVRNVPAFSKAEYGGEEDPELKAQWLGFDLGAALGAAFDRPTVVANDADMQGCAVVRRQGMEFVLTLGTGAGSALFYDGRLLPHLELGHAPLRKRETVEQQIGNVARKAVGNKTWSKRVRKALDAYYQYLFYDRVYIGGGNAKYLLASDLPDNAEIVPNVAGIIGGVRIWEMLEG